MAPLALPASIQTLPTTVVNILTTIHKRSSDCTYYDTSCGTHRTVILVIIIIVGAVVGLVLSLVYLRGRRRRITRTRERTARYAVQRKRLSEPFIGGVYEAPPPYMPRQPENAAMVWR